MVLGETQGIILFTRDYKEKDKLVKIYTESFGKLMFFVRGAHKKNNPLSSAILPFTRATYIGEFKMEGLSFLNAGKNIEPFRKIQEDIFIHAYATYLLNLVDAAIEDRVYDSYLYSFISQALDLLNQEKDPEIITNIFETQLLNRFGITIDWSCCAVCQKNHGKFDYSSSYSGLLCEEHWSLDDKRYHADPKGIHFIRLFSSISFENIQSIEVSILTKQAIRIILDELYEEYVGIRLKSKRFIDQMKSWENMLKKPPIK